MFLSLSSVSLQINCIPSCFALDKHLNIDQQTFTSNKLHTMCLSELVHHQMFFLQFFNQIQKISNRVIFLFSLKLECEKLVQEKTEMQRHYVMVSAKIDDAPIPIGVTNHLLPNDESDSAFNGCQLLIFISSKKCQQLPYVHSLSFIWMKPANVILPKIGYFHLEFFFAKLCTK